MRRPRGLEVAEQEDETEAEAEAEEVLKRGGGWGN